MTVLLFTSLVWITSLLAGFLGALTGLGGGVVLVPALALVFGVDIRYAIGTSLVSVIATSSGAAAAYVKEGYSNVRIGMLLEIATTLGALAGALLATHVSTQTIAIVFGLVLIYSAYQSFLETGLLGIGSGAVKVIVMDRAMRIPFKVSTTTSNFMIGVTAAASAGVYLSRGYIDPGLAMPVVLGVLTGSLLGTRVLVRSRVRTLRRVFASVIFLLALEMLFNGFTGRL